MTNGEDGKWRDLARSFSKNPQYKQKSCTFTEMSLSYLCIMFIVNKVQLEVLYVAQIYIFWIFRASQLPAQLLPTITPDN
jgi:hypothetical protein